jgi:hypothetical protein
MCFAGEGIFGASSKVTERESRTHFDEVMTGFRVAFGARTGIVWYSFRLNTLGNHRRRPAGGRLRRAVRDHEPVRRSADVSAERCLKSAGEWRGWPRCGICEQKQEI